MSKQEIQNVMSRPTFDENEFVIANSFLCDLISSSQVRWFKDIFALHVRHLRAKSGACDTTVDATFSWYRACMIT